MARVLVVVLAYAAAGVLAGVAWEALWEPVDGVVLEGRLLVPGPDASFSGTGLYVLLAFPVGLVLGAAAACLPRGEGVTLAAVVLGSVVAGWLMYVVGHHLGPADPSVLAAGEEDYTRLPADLVLVGPAGSGSPFRSTAFLAFPAGGVAGLALIYLSGFRSRAHR